MRLNDSIAKCPARMVRGIIAGAGQWFARKGEVIPRCLNGTLALFAVTLISISVANAQEQKPGRQDISNLSLEDLMKIEVNSVYGASRFLQKVTEAPASVSIITSEEIKRYGYVTLADAIRSVRGFYINYTRSYSDLGARGFARPGDFNTRVLLLVDGHRISDNIYNSALVGAEFPISVDLIDRIEVIRGPSSSLYGTNAFFGVINIITKRGRGFDGPEIAAETASYDSYRARVSYGKQFSNGFEMLVSGSLSDSQGHRRLYFKEFDSPETNNGIAENADGEDVRQLFANLSWREFSLQAVYGDRTKHIPTASFGTAFNDPGTFTDDERGYLDLKYEHAVNKNAELKARLYYDHYYYHADYVYSIDGENGKVRAVDKDSARGIWWGGELSLTASLLNKHKLTVGSEYRDNLHQDQKSYFQDPFISFVDDHKSSKEWAAYVEDEYRIRKNLLLNGGVRYDHSTAFGGSTNPRFGLVYDPFPKTTIKFLYGQAFRAPNVYEMRFGAAAAPQSKPPLSPEGIKTAELVIERYLGDHVRVAASGFSYRIKNLINQVADPEGGSPFFTNIGKIRSKGIESEIEAKLRYGIQGLLSYAYQDSRDIETGNKLTNSPTHMAKVNLNAPLATQRLLAGIELQYLSKRKTLAEDNAGAFLLTNVTLLSQRLAKQFDLSFSVYNLLDRRYGNPGTEEHRQDTIPQDGRSFRFKITYRLPQKK